MIDTERAQHWLDHGAQPTRTVARPAPHPGHRGSRPATLRRPSRCATCVEFLVRALVDDPDDVEVEEVEEDGDLVLEVSVAEDDLGRVIGRGGRIANAIRTVAKAAAVRDRRVS